MNQKAFEAVVLFSQKILTYFKEQNFEPRQEKKIRTIFQENGIYYQEIIETQNWVPIFHNSTTIIRTMPEGLKAVDVLIEEKLFSCDQLYGAEGKKVINPSFSSVHWLLVSKIQKVVIDYLDKYQPLIFDLDRFKEAYSPFESSLKEMGFTPTIFSILPINFDSDFEEIALSKGIIIKKLSSQDKTEFWAKTECISIMDVNEFNNCNYIINGSCVHGDSWETIDGLFNCITALRLLKSNMIGSSSLFQSVYPITRNFSNSQIDNEYYIRPSNIHGSYIEKPYFLKSEEIEIFREIHNLLCDPSKNTEIKKIRFGIRRFNYTYTRQRIEDKIIDLTIALESTLLFGIRDELKYRVAVRCATMLKDEFNAKKTFEILKDLYDIRSNIVHNGQDLSEISKNGELGGMPIDIFYLEIEQIVRKVLLKYLEKLKPTMKIESINTDLENQIINGLLHK